MKRLLIGVVLSVLAVSAFAKDAPKDPKCEQVGQFAKGIATIKLAGYDMNALQNFVSEPKAQTFPLQIVKQQIYDQNIAPDPAYVKFYGQCVAVGYDVLFEYFVHEQERQQLVVDNASLKSELATLQGRIATLNTQLVGLQNAVQTSVNTRKPVKYVPPAPTPVAAANTVPAYGAPINKPIVRQ